MEEQAAGLYARAVAERGYAALAFDYDDPALITPAADAVAAFWAES